MEDNEWETIQPSSSATQSDEDAVVVTRLTNFHDPPPPVSSPSNHEGLLISPQSPQDDNLQQPLPETPSPPSSYSSSSTPDIINDELPRRRQVTSTLLKASLEILSSWVLRIACGIRSGIGFWSIASLASFVTIVAYARRWQQWRRLPEKDNTDQLLLLINQKDEKIKQLLLQIDRMNEALLARRRVPVFRVVVNSPFVVAPRSN